MYFEEEYGGNMEPFATKRIRMKHYKLVLRVPIVGGRGGSYNYEKIERSHGLDIQIQDHMFPENKKSQQAKKRDKEGGENHMI